MARLPFRFNGLQEVDNGLNKTVDEMKLINKKKKKTSA